MKVTSINRSPHQGDGRLRTLAFFDIEISEDIRVYGMRLLEGVSGRPLTYAPNASGGRRLATFSPKLAEAITYAAVAAYEGHDTANDRNSI